METLPHYLEPYRFSPEITIRDEQATLLLTFPEFSAIADWRVRPLDPEAYTAWKRLRDPTFNPQKRIDACSFDFRTRLSDVLAAPMTTLMALDVVANRDAYTLQGVDYTDLIRYGIEHEKWETWQRIAFEVLPKFAHPFARMHQYVVAHRDGKAQRLLEFYQHHADTFGEPLSAEHLIALDFAENHPSATTGERPQPPLPDKENHVV